MTPKTSTERVLETRARRKAQGLKRVELYLHPDDAPAVRKLADRLTRKRLKGNSHEG